MQRIVVGLVLALGILLSPVTAAVSPALAASECQFTLGFKSLHDLIPDIVGECVENARYAPDTGNALQRTTRGLLFWRKADNFTAFTDGYHTWINGPEGLQERLNSERFTWEVVSPDSLKNLTYHVEGPPGNVAKLTNGTFSVPAAPGSASKITVTLLDRPIVYADLYGDGDLVALVVLAVNTGGSGTFEYLAVVRKVHGAPQNVATVFLGDRVQVQYVTVGPGTITVDLIQAGPGQPLCCPNELVTRTYRLQGNQLIQIG